MATKNSHAKGVNVAGAASAQRNRTTPALPARKLLTKSRLPISVRFAKRPGYDTLQIRISADGVEGSPFSTLPDKTALYATGINWDQKLQRSTGRTDADRKFNQEIDSVRAKIHDVFDRQIGYSIKPTPKSVQSEYQTGKPFEPTAELTSVWSPVRCYTTYLNEIKAGSFPEKQLAQTTLDKWTYGLTYLQGYVQATKESDCLSVGPADELTLFWGKSYHRWLMQQGMAAEAATRYVKRLIEAIDYIAETGAVKRNPLATLKLSRAKTKDVHFLDPEQLSRFWQLSNQGEAGKHIWWMGLIFLTGLDHPDAVRYAQNPHYFERQVEGGKVIVINRSKPPKSECWIPVLPQLEALMRCMPEGEPPTNERINDYMRGVEAQIGFPHRLTCKVGRKTAGAIFFAEFEDIGAVSRMMGHSSVSITERYYVKTTGYTVTRAIRKRYVQSSQSHPFVHIQKAA